MCPGARFSLNSVPSGQLCFISLIFLSFLPQPPKPPPPVFALSPFLFSLSPLSFIGTLTLTLSTHTQTHAHMHTLSLGYYRDKSIWSILGRECHFIHIFSSLLTLLKATASIYPEWMNAPTDETQKRWGRTVWNDRSRSAPVIFKHVFKNPVFYAIRNSLLNRSLFGTMFSIHVWVKRPRAACPPFHWQENGCWDFQQRREKMRCNSQSVEAESRECWSPYKNVSIHANWCPDPPSGSYCLLSGGGIKGPFTGHEDFLFIPTRPHLSPLIPFSSMVSILLPNRG